MDDSETPTNNLQIEPQDGRRPGDSVESTVARSPSVSDENENRLEGNGPERLTSSSRAMGKPQVLEQDSLNNNESCTSSCEVAAGENSENTPREGPKDGQTFLGKDKRIPAKRSSRSKKGTAKKIPPGLSSGDTIPLMQEKIVSAAMHAAGDEETAGVNAQDHPEAPKLVLQSLFSLIRGEVELLDSRALPLCLHQIAESYFQEEDYEKAMKFIQLERLYHEQLLANLSAIQKQWETKWKTVQPHTVTSLRNSEKGFNSEDFERLSKFCTTHQDPFLSKQKKAAIEKSLGRKCFMQLIVSEDPKEKGVTATESESEACLEEEPSKESQHQAAAGERSACCDQIRPQAGAGTRHGEELLGSAEATLALHAPSPETAGSRAGPDSSENACEADSHLELPEPGACENAPQTQGIAEDADVLLSSKSVTEPLAAPGCDHTPPPPALAAEGRYSQNVRKELQLPLQAEALPADPLENSESKDLPGRDGKSPQGHSDAEGSGRALCENNDTPDVSAVLPEAWMAPEDDPVSQEAEDYLNSLLEGCLREPEGSLYEETQDLSPEEASYSLQETPPADDSSLSLDDLAKRIEIAELVPAEGLVSILKKRNDSVGNHSAQMQQKPSKRRVRFQEIEDNLDQDEVGGGSCILLILLCLATVFLSVGGTALYCTFGDIESPVCTDFADNMDFYYTKLVQGMAELKHWIYLS